MKSRLNLLSIFVTVTSMVIFIGRARTERHKILAKVMTIMTPDGRTVTSTLTETGYHEPVIIVYVVAEDKEFTLDLHLNTGLLAAGYREKICTDKGDYYSNSKQSLDFCYYVGVVRGYTGSTASLSTCKKISGFFFAGDNTYSITSAGSNTEAIVEKEESNKWTCGVLSSLSKAAPRLRKRSLNGKIDRKTRFIEVYVISDSSHYSQFNDIALTTQRIKQIANGANALYNTVDMYMVLVGLEIWTTSKIDVVSDSSVTLTNFYVYKNTTLNNAAPSHDNAVLIVATPFDNSVIGLAQIGTMCHSIYSGNFISDLYKFKYTDAMTSALMTHEMGHNLGLVHDTERDPCPCGDVTGTCIMNPSMDTGKNAPTKFSSCSKSDLVSKRSEGLDLCLFNAPDTMSVIYIDASICGDGIIEQGEDCDCGGLPDNLCNPHCCDKTTCKLKGLANCSMGMCCDIQTCTITISNTVCRDAQGGCDIPELCNGVSAFCPSDVYKQDGTSCSVAENPAYCYRGKCNNHESQCKKLWNSNASQASSLCYSQLNIKGTIDGSCQIILDSVNSYIPCDITNVMCGQLFCNTQNQTPTLRSESRGFYMFNDVPCHWAYLDFGRQILTPAFVPDGAVCGPSRTCINQTCIDVAALIANTSQCLSDCPGGACANNGQCKCTNGLTYPNCNDIINTKPATTTNKVPNSFVVTSPERITYMTLIIINFIILL